MSHFFRTQRALLLVYGIALLMVFFGVVLLAAPGSAQEVPENTTSTPTPEDTPTQLYDQLFNLDIHEVEFTKTDESGHVVEVEATWNGPAPERLTVTQITDSKNVAIDKYTIRPDETTRFTIDLVDDSNAILYTDESLNRGRATVLESGDGWLISGPWSATDAQVTGAAGLVAGLLLTSTLAYRKISSFDDEPERIL